MTADDERELVRLFLRGEASAAWRILMTFGPAMHQAAFRITQDSDQADDVVQEALLRVLRKGERYRGGSLGGWLRAVSVRVALNQIRSSRRALTREDAFAHHHGESPCAEADPLLRDALRDEIGRLPEVERTVFTLVELDGCSHAEVGEALGISAEASRQRLLTARRLLRAALQPLRDRDD